MRTAKKKKNKTASSFEYSGHMSPVKNGEVTAFSTKKVTEAMGEQYPIVTISKLAQASSWDNKGGMKPAEKLRVYDKYVPILIDMYFAQQEIIAASVKETKRATENTLERGGKRWEQDEDETLIELASIEGNSLAQIAIMMGRTPAAIQSRISYLVGISRMTQEIAGRFIGTFNGESMHGYIEGSLTKSK